MALFYSLNSTDIHSNLHAAGARYHRPICRSTSSFECNFEWPLTSANRLLAQNSYRWRYRGICTEEYYIGKLAKAAREASGLILYLRLRYRRPLRSAASGEQMARKGSETQDSSLKTQNSVLARDLVGARGFGLRPGWLAVDRQKYGDLFLLAVGACPLHILSTLNWYCYTLVGARGFEPPTSCSQSRRATGLRYAPTSSASNV